MEVNDDDINHQGTSTSYRLGVSGTRSTSSRNTCKRKQPDEDEQVLTKIEERLTETQIDNEYEHLDEGSDDEDGVAIRGDDDETDAERRKCGGEANDDEEERRRKFNLDSVLKAQEPSTITQYDDIKITPFNIEEELEEGEFDSAGNYIFRREKRDKDELANDTWAESIDWAAVEKQERERREKANSKQTKQSTTEGVTNTIARDKLSCYKQMLRLMKSHETVQKAIRRLGNECPRRRPYNKNKRSINTDETQTLASVDAAEARRQLDLMIELAHQRLEDGDLNIYQKSFDDLEEAIN